MEKDVQYKKLRRFLEEFSWLLESYSDIDLSKLHRVLEERSVEKTRVHGLVKNFRSDSPGRDVLVGVLPRLFMDERLFSQNDDIAEFAFKVLGVQVPRYHKKSKYEIIGHIVCEALTLNDQDVYRLALALQKVAGDDYARERLSHRKHDHNFSWNEIISELSN